MISRLRIKIQKILQLDSTPSRIAASSAVGVIIGFSPYMGFHTVLAIGISFIFNLPLYPLIVGAYITNPLTFIPLYTLCYKFGELITGQHAELTVDFFSDLTFSTIFTTAKTFIVPFFCGCSLPWLDSWCNNIYSDLLPS